MKFFNIYLILFAFILLSLPNLRAEYVEIFPIEINQGYSGSGVETCNPNTCNVNATCTNDTDNGTVNCTCNDGYYGDGYNCTLVETCRLDSCDVNAICGNGTEKRTITCTCKEGYTGNGYNCTRVETCDPNPCNVNATCTNDTDNGTVNCTCNDGYYGDGCNCTLVETCKLGSCDVNAICENGTEKGTITCTCKEGYTGNGYNCARLVTCVQNPCDTNADCSDIDGNVTCTCKNDYTGDGYKCIKVKCPDDPNYCGTGFYCSDAGGMAECKCKPPSAKVGDFCQTALNYGGKLYAIFPSTSLKRNSEEGDVALMEVKDVLESAYGNVNGFLSVNLLVDSIQNEYPYVTHFTIDSGINETSIKQALSKYLGQAGNCTTGLCMINNLAIERNKSVDNAANNSDLICLEYTDYCDKSTTNCNAIGQSLSCDCKPGHVGQEGNEQFCEAIICANDVDCNSPHGACIKNVNVGSCSCSTGYSGTYCKDATLLALIIVLSIVVFIVLVGTIYVFKQNRKTPKLKYIESNGTTKAKNLYGTVENSYADESGIFKDNLEADAYEESTKL